MAKHKITLLPGDGIGPEVTAAVVSIIECAGVDVEWEKYFVGAEAISRFGDPLPPEVLESILRNKIALKGPVTTPVGTGFSSINVRLRKTLDLYANLRPVKSMPNIITRYEDVDVVVVRENTEDLYSGLEHEVVPGVVESLKIITERASTRIARFAFEYARTHGRKRVTAVHKANIMKLSDGLFLQCFRNVSHNAVVKSVVLPVPPMSRVRCSGPEPSTFTIASLIRLAGPISPMCSSISTADCSSASGFALFCPAMSGALPCTASKTAPFSPMFAPATTPRPPTRPAARSDTMSP